MKIQKKRENNLNKFRSFKYKKNSKRTVTRNFKENSKGNGAFWMNKAEWIYLKFSQKIGKSPSTKIYIYISCREALLSWG
ncbi:hypothetical protein evm_005539 [Chilo suppressalis]|nr:hypothetical protein evm_005539 [Chilo suppressalis]